MERMPLKRIPELEIGIEHGVAPVPPKLLEPGRVHATLHAGAERATLEAMARDQLRVEARG